MSLPALARPTSHPAVPRSASSSALHRPIKQGERGRPSRVARGTPYAVNFAAECERIEEEQRVRRAFESARQRRGDQERERLRRQVVERARDEERQVHQLYRQKVAVMEEQKRLKALREVELANERYLRERSDIRRRFYEPPAEVVNQREEEWQMRRQQRTRDLQERLKKVEAITEQRRKDLLRLREERREHVYQRSMAMQADPATRERA
ncbi:hypothetical protein AB1Y20_018102 [Prymnesium parvum]|uniref:Meiosis-specific nuclear structural protein 1 n=1 Tax=Prymnesium parvum TaxID=97485 RepID=A0AB34JQV7_PRYPA